MTLDEFFEALEKTPRDWYLRSDGAIRTRGNYCCTRGNYCPFNVISAIWSIVGASGLTADVGKQLICCQLTPKIGNSGSSISRKSTCRGRESISDHNM